MREREFDDWKVRWFKLAGGQQILAEYAWKGGTIVPVICCVGNEIVVDGKRRYWVSSGSRATRSACTTSRSRRSPRTVALSPKAPFMVAEGQDEGYEEEYELANRRNYSVLHYKPTTHEGHLMPAPQRNQPATVPTGLVEIANVSRGDLRSTIGIYDPSLGQKSNETSGIAIQRREAQGDVATFNFPDNRRARSRLTGRILDEFSAALLRRRDAPGAGGGRERQGRHADDQHPDRRRAGRKRFSKTRASRCAWRRGRRTRRSGRSRASR